MEQSLNEQEKVVHLQCYFLHRLIKRLMDLYPGEYLDVTRFNPETLSGGRIKPLSSQRRYAELNETFQINRLPLYATSAKQYLAAFTTLPLAIQKIHQEEAERTVERLRLFQQQRGEKLERIMELLNRSGKYMESVTTSDTAQVKQQITTSRKKKTNKTQTAEVQLEASPAQDTLPVLDEEDPSTDEPFLSLLEPDLSE